MSNHTLPQRILLGLAVGDALGGAAEFQSHREALARLPDIAGGYRPGAPFGFRPGEATDDTQMTLAGLRATQAHGEGGDARAYAEAVWAAFAEWARSGPPDVGGQTAASLSTFGAAWTAYRRAVQGGRDPSAGNGGLMRAAAPFLAGRRGAALVRDTAIHTAVTHADPRCVADALALALLLEEAERELQGAERQPDTGDTGDTDFPAALRRVESHLCSAAALAAQGCRAVAETFGLGEPEADAYRAALEAALAGSAETLRAGAAGALGSSGYTRDTLRGAVAHLSWAWHHGGTRHTPGAGGTRYARAILGAAQTGDDADTVACVTGALAAAFDPAAFDFPAAQELLADLRIGHTWPLWPDRDTPATPVLLAWVGPRKRV